MPFITWYQSILPGLSSNTFLLICPQNDNQVKMNGTMQKDTEI